MSQCTIMLVHYFKDYSMKIHFDPNRPIYRQLMDEIKKRTVRGQYLPGGKLPSVRDLAGEIEVNPNTIARVFNELEREGFIETRRGMGSYITEDTAVIDKVKKQLIDEAVDSFIRETKSLNLDENTIAHLIESIRSHLEKDKVL